MSLDINELVNIEDKMPAMWVVYYNEDVKCPICMEWLTYHTFDEFRLYWCSKCQPICPKCGSDTDLHLDYIDGDHIPSCLNCDYIFNEEVIKDPGYE